MAGIRKQKFLLHLDDPEEIDKAIFNLLMPHKTIRDAIHEDIEVSRVETAILDTDVFQRLHKIKQLGPSYLVYPCAKHTRFDHSLGTLYMAQYLINQVLKNPFKDPNVSIYVNSPYISVHYPSSATVSTAKITNYHVLLIRVSALLHDLAHIPFGHTLEDEGYLFEGQWKDRVRLDYFLGDESRLGKNIVEIVNQYNLDGTTFLQNVREILQVKDENDVSNLDYPFVADIISNTICADLLDYVKRDIYFCGLKEDYDRRFLKYFYIGSYKDKPRLLLRLIKPKTGKIRRDVLSETLHLLRLRYSLAEKVYYHHAKISASAMIISAANSALQNENISNVDLFKIGDDEFLTLLKKDEIGKYLVEKLEERKLYKPVYKLVYTEPTMGAFVSDQKSKIIEEFTDRKKRYERERDLERMNRLKQGQVVIYCPSHEMGQKAIKTLCDWGNGMGSLDTLPDERIKSEIRASILKKHLELWNMDVFVDPDLDEATKVNIASDSAREIFHNLSNEIENEGYHLTEPGYLERFKEQGEAELGITIAISVHKDMCFRYSDTHTSDVLSYEDYLSLIKEIK